MKATIIAAIVGMLLLTGCTSSTATVVPIVINETGISSQSGEIIVDNFHSGARAEVTYRIRNDTYSDLIPKITFIPSDRPRDNYTKAPSYTADWLSIERSSTIRSGETKNLLLTLEMPKNTESPAPKWEFRTEVAGSTKGMVQTAIAIRWFVNMR